MALYPASARRTDTSPRVRPAVFPVVEKPESAASAARAEFALLYKRVGSEIFSHALGLLDSAADAEKVTIEVFVALWREWPATRAVNSGHIQSLSMIGCARRIAVHPAHPAPNLLPWHAAAPACGPEFEVTFERSTLGERVSALESAKSQLLSSERTLLDAAFATFDRGASPLTVAGPRPARPSVHRVLLRLHRHFASALQDGVRSADGQGDGDGTAPPHPTSFPPFRADRG